MIETVIMVLGWVIVGLIVVAVLLRLGERGEERSRETRD
jgi:hypothetical protein